MRDARLDARLNARLDARLDARLWLRCATRAELVTPQNQKSERLKKIVTLRRSRCTEVLRFVGPKTNIV